VRAAPAVSAIIIDAAQRLADGAPEHADFSAAFRRRHADCGRERLPRHLLAAFDAKPMKAQTSQVL